jgi:TfoX/Sxy family transcriptional regulator of competence genes
MAYNEKLAVRIREKITGIKDVSEKKMFGGIAFLLNGKMFCGVLKDDLVARVNKNDSDNLLKIPNVRPMDFTGRPMKGFLYIGPKQTGTSLKLDKWLKITLDYVKSLKNE